MYILYINSLLDVWFASVFSHSVASLFTLLTISFTVQKLFSLIWFVYFAYVAYIFGVISKRSFSRLMSGNFLPLLSSSCFMVSGLKSLIHFELIFVCGVRWVQFHFFAYRWTVSHTIIEDYPLHIAYSWQPYQRTVDHICLGLFLGSLFCSTDLRVFLCQYHTVLITVAL